MGVISRQIFPVCESLCFFCPALRARSRHPVKRYKKLLADIFPRSQVDIFGDDFLGLIIVYVGFRKCIAKISMLFGSICMVFDIDQYFYFGNLARKIIIIIIVWLLDFQEIFYLYILFGF